MTTNPPIGHLPDEHNHQQCRDAAAGPPEPCSPGTEKWPGPVKKSTKYHGAGIHRNDHIRFTCAECGWMLGTISALIIHTVVQHKRPPHDSERVPVT